MSPRLHIALQVPATLAVVAWVPGNVAKLVLLVALWALTFGRVRRSEAALFLGACVLFTGMNAMALRQGIFRFSEPDVLGMPLYELGMWGFYLLHTRRLWPAPAAALPGWILWLTMACFALSFVAITDSLWLLVASGLALASAVALSHRGPDLVHAAYMVVLGLLVEATGVASGQWSYPSNPPLGVPLWFMTLWGGVGYFASRVAWPWFVRLDTADNKAEPHAR